MEILEIGEKLEGVDYPYRENCFGIVDMGEQIMLVYSKKDNNHSLPGGGVESGEPLQKAIEREFIEEAGYKIKSAKEIVQVHCYWNYRDGKNHFERHSHIMLVELDENSKTTPTEDWHIRVYVDKKDVINLVPYPYQKAGIEYYFNNYKK